MHAEVSIEKTEDECLSDELNISIPIPADDEGYVLLRCPKCGEYFKLTTSDCRDDGYLWAYCPFCGLVSNSYITQEVYELGMKILQNAADDMIYSSMKQLERKTRNSMVKIKVGKSPRHRCTDPIHSGIEAMEEVQFLCCKRTAKISPMLILTGCYCPFCGVRYDEFE